MVIMFSIDFADNRIFRFRTGGAVSKSPFAWISGIKLAFSGPGRHRRGECEQPRHLTS